MGATTVSGRDLSPKKTRPELCRGDRSLSLSPPPCPNRFCRRQGRTRLLKLAVLIGIFLLVGRVDVRFWMHRSPDYSSAPILREKFDADSLRGEVRRRGVVPWKLAGTGRDRSRDMLENWWLSHPNAPAGLSCAKLSSHTEPGGAENDVFSALGQVGSNFTLGFLLYYCMVTSLVPV